MDAREDDDRGDLARLLRVQAGLVEIIGAALLLGFGINLLATAVSDHVSTIWGIALGAVASLGGITLLVFQALGARARSRTIRGFFLYDPTDASVIAPGGEYPFGTWFAMYLQAACREQPKIGELWASGREERLSGLPRMELAQDLVEYVALKDLSTHLSDYFDEQQSEALHHITREELPDALRSNPFIEFFARPPAERPGFTGGTGANPTFSESSVMTIVVGGGLFEKFELILPEGASITRAVRETLVLTTKRFTVRLTASSPGTVTSLPTAYLALYLGLGRRAADVLAVDSWLTIDISFRARALFTPRGWVYYKWLDSWLAAAEKSMSSTRYFSHIGWQQAETIHNLLHARDELKARRPSSESGPEGS